MLGPGVSLIPLTNFTHNDARGMVTMPVIPEHRGMIGALHFVNSIPGTPARGNHHHDVSEVLVFLQGTWLLRTKRTTSLTAHDYTIDADGTRACDSMSHMMHSAVSLFRRFV